MKCRKPWLERALIDLKILPALVLLTTSCLGATPAVSAQFDDDMRPMQISAVTCDDAGACFYEVGAQFTVTTQDGEYIGSCTLEGDRQATLEIAGNVNCSVLIPVGITVVVTENTGTITPGTVPEENPLSFTWPEMVPSYVGVIFRNVPVGGSVSSGQTSNVAIVTTEQGQPVYDACYVLVDYSNVGCDENRDGKVTFQDVPLGTYTVRQTADLGPGRSVNDFTIQVTGAMSSDGWERFNATIVSSSAAPSTSGAVDIALITRDPDTGELLTGTCYVLVGYSNEGCDENGDGQVTFDAVPYDTYTVRQTKTPTGYPTINDFEIFVAGLGGVPGSEPFEVPLGFVVKQASEQNLPGTYNVSVILLDMETHEKIPAEICVEFVGASNVGCDDGLLDGQVDFLDLPAGGPYEVRFSHLPPGYEVYEEVTRGEPMTVTIDDTPDMMSNRFMFVLLVRADSAMDTGSVSGGATLLMTFRGCPEGFDPAIADFDANCTIPLDAPDASLIYWGGDGEGGMNIAWLDRQNDGTHIR
jgi:hypothetical protein